MCKKFGNFPEHLAALYTAQVLKGLEFLHEQGTIHRDIKGANILTTKDGLAKLADFGVATKVAKLEDKLSIVGTPNWMAPEVIELNGATTASDIWSVGCTVIELLTGNPPYHRLDHMQTLYAIVNRDYPPIPEGITPLAQDFLIQCFQRDHNLRVTAKNLLKHAWLAENKKAAPSTVYSHSPTQYEEAVKTVQKWNKAITSNDDAYSRTANRKRKPTYKPTTNNNEERKPTSRIESKPFSTLRYFSQARQLEFRGMMRNSPQKGTLSPTECWDQDFPEDVPEKLTGYEETIQKSVAISSPSSTDSDEYEGNSVIEHMKKTTGSANQLLQWQETSSIQSKKSSFRDDSEEDYSDLIGELDIAKLPDSAKRSQLAAPSKYHPSELSGIFRHMASHEVSKTPKVSTKEPRSISEQSNSSPVLSKEEHSKKAIALDSFQESEEDYDYSDMFRDQKKLDFDFKRQNSAGVNFEEDEREGHDPFAEFEKFDESNIVENVARERLAHAQIRVESILDNLNKNMKGSYLVSYVEELHELLHEFPVTSKTVLKCHGLLLLLEVLELHVDNKTLVPGLLQILILLLEENHQSVENFCLLGGITLITKLTSKKYDNEIRMQAASVISLLCNSEKYGLPMLLACGGLCILADFIEEDCVTQPEFVSIGINGVWSVFEHQGSTPRNDICRKLSKHGILDSLSIVLKSLLSEPSTENIILIDRIVSIFVYFSQAESFVKNATANRTLFCNLFKCFSNLNTQHQLSVLKFIKNMSSLPEILPILQNANTIDYLTNVLSGATKKPVFKDYASQILHTMYNLCRLSQVRQEEAAQCGIIPALQEAVAGDLPLKEFALPILCDMALAGKICRKALWQNNGLDTYLGLTSDPYWQVKAYDAIFFWLQEDFARVEVFLLNERCTKQLFNGLEGARGTFFDAVLAPFLQIMRSSAAICGALATTRLFQLIKTHLNIPRPMLRLNLLRLLRVVLDHFPEKLPLVKDTGLYHNISLLSKSDDAVMVKQLTKELLELSISAESKLENDPFYRSPSKRASLERINDDGSYYMHSGKFNSSLNSPAGQTRSSISGSSDSTRSATSNWRTHRPSISQPTFPAPNTTMMLPPKSPTRRTKHLAHASLSNPTSSTLNSSNGSLRDEGLSSDDNNFHSSRSHSPEKQKDNFVISTPKKFLNLKDGNFDIDNRSRSPPSRSPVRRGRVPLRDSLYLSDRSISRLHQD